MKFVPGGPARYQHQLAGLRLLIRTGGVGALLFEPGLGKTATTLDFLSILALKSPPSSFDGVPEARVLVIAPLAAVDTWVKQARIWMSPQVDFWVEALGGSIKQRAETLAHRGGWYGRAKPRRIKDPATDKRVTEHLRAYGWHRSIEVDSRDALGIRTPFWQGPSVLGRLEDVQRGVTGRPRLVIEVVNFDTFKSRTAVGSRTMADVVLDAVEKYDPQCVVVDESHIIKGASSNVSRLVARIGERAPRRIILTGTVMPAGPMDVYGQWRFLDPHAFGEPLADGTRRKTTLESFRRQYAVMGGWQGQQVVGYRNLDRLQRIMGERSLSVRKMDALDLPPVLPIVVPVVLSADEKRAYQEMKKGLASKLGPVWMPPPGTITHPDGSMSLPDGTPVVPPHRDSATAKSRLTQMLRLRQITAGHLPDDLGRVHRLGDSKVRTVASTVNDTLAGEKRVVVFCLFRHEFDELVKTLNVAGTTVLGINGDTPKPQRLAHRARFGTSVDAAPDRLVLVAQVMTLNLSVNELVTASHVAFASLPQQRDVLIQAIDRLNRIGQKNRVTVWFHEAPNTVDGVIHASHDDRTDLETAILKHINDVAPEASAPALAGGAPTMSAASA